MSPCLRLPVSTCDTYDYGYIWACHRCCILQQLGCVWLHTHPSTPSIHISYTPSSDVPQMSSATIRVSILTYCHTHNMVAHTPKHTLHPYFIYTLLGCAAIVICNNQGVHTDIQSHAQYGCTHTQTHPPSTLHTHPSRICCKYHLQHSRCPHAKRNDLLIGSLG